MPEPISACPAQIGRRLQSGQIAAELGHKHIGVLAVVRMNVIFAKPGGEIRRLGLTRYIDIPIGTYSHVIGIIVSAASQISGCQQRINDQRIGGIIIPDFETVRISL